MQAVPSRAAMTAWRRALVRQLRVYQWTKNALVFVPMIAAHDLRDRAMWVDALIAFLAFSLAASSVYVVNDLCDLDADRQHPRKRLRPLAAGELSARFAKLLVPTLPAGSAGVAIRLPAAFVTLLLLYWVATLAYSLGLKKRPILDVALLAALYTVRVYAGG